MMRLELKMLLPVVFMVHEYEEIIMFRHWLDRNRDELKRRSSDPSSLYGGDRGIRYLLDL